MAKVLVIDDSSFLRKMVRACLRGVGHEVVEAAGGPEGLAMIESLVPDCVLLDLAMPSLDGLEVLAALRRRGITVPVIVVTADVQDTTRAQCLQLGARAVVNKPPTARQLAEAIDGAMRTRNPQGAAP